MNRSTHFIFITIIYHCKILICSSNNINHVIPFIDYPTCMRWHHHLVVYDTHTRHTQPRNIHCVFYRTGMSSPRCASLNFSVILMTRHLKGTVTRVKAICVTCFKSISVSCESHVSTQHVSCVKLILIILVKLLCVTYFKSMCATSVKSTCV